MTNLVARVLEMLIRVRQFGLIHAPHFPTGSRGRELFDLVNGFIETIEEQSATHEQHARAAKEKTTIKKAAVAGLRELMSSISRTARGMAPSTPGMENKFQMPGGSSVQKLLAAARSFLLEAEPLKAEFIRRGLPSNFVDDLRGRILSVAQAVDEQAQKSEARISASVSAVEAVRGARAAVRELGSIMRNVYAADAAPLAEWESASHVERAPRHAEEEAATPPAPPAPAQV